MMARSRLKAILSVVALSLLAAFPVGAQVRELRIYNWPDYIAPEVLDAFKAQTGITAVYDSFDRIETMEATLSAGKSGYDLVVVPAAVLARQAALGLYAPIEAAKAPNLKNVEPLLQARLAVYDPGNRFAVAYMWGTIGLGYNVAKLRERLGPETAVDSWKILFEPERLRKLADCGVQLPDAAEEMFPAALRHLGLNPASRTEADLNKAADVLRRMRPHIRRFHSADFVNALASGEACLVLGSSADVRQAKLRAAEAANAVEIGYAIPKEGAAIWLDSFVIPKDSAHPEAALAFIDFVNRPEMAAKNAAFVGFASGNLASRPLLPAALRDNAGLFPPDAVMARLYAVTPYDQKTRRLADRLWARVKTGK